MSPAGPRLDLWLVENRGITRHAAQTLIEAGAVTVNEKPGRAGQKIREQDQILVAELPMVENEVTATDVELNIVYEDDELAVIDKPAGMVVHPAPGHATGTLADGLRQTGKTWSLLGGEDRPGIVHRLDRDSSGLLVVAKTENAHRVLAAQLQKRTMRRIYWALAIDVIREDSGEIHAPIGRNPKDLKKMAVTDNGREAITDFRVLNRFARHTEAEVSLRTGRTHQIRVHFAFIKHPLVGDVLYGRDDHAPRLALHAKRLEFVHPDSLQPMSFASELPSLLMEMRQAAQAGRL